MTHGKTPDERFHGGEGVSRERCRECGCFLRGELWLPYLAKINALPHADKRVVVEKGAPSCTVCWLVAMTSQHVRWHDDEERDFTAEGESLNSVIHREVVDGIAEGLGTVEWFNSGPELDESTATSKMLPAGCHEEQTLNPHDWERLRGGDNQYQSWLQRFANPLTAWTLKDFAIAANVITEKD